MAFFLEVRSGPKSGSKFRLTPGRLLRVGRTAQSDLSFADDSHMSGLHFSLGWQDAGCLLSDLNSRNGTLVNGKTTTAVVLQHGDTIVAGETTFAILIEADEPLAVSNVAAPAPSPVQPSAIAQPAPPVPPALEPATTPQERLLPILRRDLQPLYAILDAARDIRILALLVHHKAECQSLYEGVEGAKLAQVAPYLVRLAPDSPLLEALVKEGWGKSWGVYLTCANNFDEIRRHLRHFLQAKLPDGEQVYFRFYDPRVMRVFLPTCIAEETSQFFGPIKRYVMEGEEPTELWEFTTIGRGAEKRTMTLIPSGEEDKAMSASARPPAPLIEKPTSGSQR